VIMVYALRFSAALTPDFAASVPSRAQRKTAT
jgi:hypothetical protein